MSGDAAVVRLQGELDLAAAPLLERALLPVIADRPRRVIVDLRAVDFMGSTGLHALSQLRHRLGEDSQLLVVRGPERVQRVLEITGLTGTLRFVDAADVDAE
jgi:anti-sigma B factor antagonist